jgi:hypothetical protein
MIKYGPNGMVLALWGGGLIGFVVTYRRFAAPKKQQVDQI